MISRRTLLRRLAAGAGAAAVAHRFDRPLDAQSGPAPQAGGHPIRLDRNESAYGPSPRALDAIRDAAARTAPHYARAELTALRDRIAESHGVAADAVVLGCGTGEILRMAAESFAAGRTLITAVPSYDWMAVCAERAGARIAAVPLAHDHTHDLEAMRAQAGRTPGLVYICNPHNPTATIARRRDLDAFLEALPPDAHVVVDEAYHQYVRAVEYASVADRAPRDSRLIVARTFSKIYGLAGLRVGYAIAAPETARALAARRLADGIGSVAVAAARAALDDGAFVQACIKRNADDRQEFLNQANARMLKGFDSQTNFFMVNAAMPAGPVIEQLAARGVLVAPPIARYDTYVRVSLGTRADMDAFWRAWDEIVRMTM